MAAPRRTRRRTQASRRRPEPAIRATTAPVAITGAEAPSDTAPARFRMVANTGEPMRIGAWSDPVVIDLETADLSDQRIPALYDHWADIGSVVGQVESLAIENQELIATGRFTLSPAESGERNCAQRVLGLARAGYQWQASVGADPAQVEEIKAGAVGVANWGRKYSGPCVIGRGCKFREISFVVLGGDRRTSVVVGRSIKGEAMTFEQWLMSMDFQDPAALSDVQRTNLQLLYDDLYPEGEIPTGDDTGDGTDTAPTEPPANAADDQGEYSDLSDSQAAGNDPAMTDNEEPAPANAGANPPAIRASADPVQRRRQQAAAEEQRIADVRRICAAAGHPTMTVGRRQVPVHVHAIRSGWSLDRTELEVHRRRRPQAPAAIVRNHDRDCSVQALEGALILRCGGRIDHPSYTSPRGLGFMPDGRPKLPGWLRADINDTNRNRIMEAASRYAEFSALDLCREACRLDGREAPHGRTAMIQAAVSGMTLSNIFTTNINAILLATYMESEDTTMGWVREQDVADYRLQERPRMLKGPNLSKRPPGAQADHMTRSDSGESYKIASYSGQVEIDEQDFINDNLGALSDTPVEMGYAAARLRPDLVYSIILNNPTLTTTSRALFNSTDANLLTTATLAAATLRSAVKAQSLFQENGVNLNLMTTHVIVPPSLRHLTYELVNSSEILIAGTAGSVTERGNVNALRADGLIPVSDARLENGLTDPATGTVLSGSATTWYTACQYAHTIEVGYLRGSGRSPRVRSWKHDREGKYGLGWDVEMSIGAVALDWKGMTKNTA